MSFTPPVPPFFSKALLLLEVDRVGAGLSLFELELWEFDRGFSPLVEELFDLKVRLSAGIF